MSGADREFRIFAESFENVVFIARYPPDAWDWPADAADELEGEDG